MAITAEFKSDFTDFTRGVKEAERDIADLEQSTKQSAGGIEGAIKAIDFEKLFADPLGQAKAALMGFADTLGTVGLGVTAAVAALGALGIAFVKLAGDAADSGAELGDLSDKTGITVPALSRLSNAAQVAGTDINTLSNIAYTMQQRMATHPEEFAQGLQRLGINAREFSLQPLDEKLLAVSRALEAQEDPLERTTAGTELLGRQYRNSAAALMDLSKAAEMTADMEVWTKEQAEAAERFQMQINRIKLEFSELALSIGKLVIPALVGLIDNTKAASDRLRELWAETGWARAMATYKEWAGIAKEGVLELLGVTAKLPEVTNPAAAGIRDITKATTDGSNAAVGSVKSLTAAFGEQQRSLRTMAEERQRQAAAERELQRETKQAADEYYKGIRETLARDEKARDEQRKREAEATKVLQKVQQDYSDAVAASSTSATEVRIRNANRAAVEETKKLAELGVTSNAAYDLIINKNTATKDNIIRNTLEQDKTSKAYYEKLAREAEQAYAAAKASGENYTAAAIENLRLQAENAQQVLGNWQTYADRVLTGAKDTMASLAEQWTTFVGQKPASPFDTNRNTSTGGGTLGGTLPPGWQTPTTAELIPIYGAGGYLGMGQAMRNQQAPVTVTFNGPVLGTSHDISRAVGSALTKAYSQGGNRLPV